MEDTHQLFARATYCRDQFGRVYRCRSTWSNWGRWVALAVIVIAALILFFLIACISSRRRRKAGRKPFYGTGWAGNARPPFGGQQQQYNPNYNTQQPHYGQQTAPPNYNQSTGGYYGQPQGGEAQSYFGGQRGDVEMNNSGYAPPAGPPPSKVVH
ncbi:uncharacterized protein HMPREF1541_05779 [Cyphellophora europaea CBS 101466]|uniref:Uncharacterized protein n=1 Tax=Cyphellophora europaea (strain CBS 101466) TaxID=1220924 RepID=W2RUW3_CYPE1|nr:uncharacterized protein HMPREF1541_05779 [Cyphellophora europaea CBS 101466]ETN39553.1 hypothetical protein HMPREF1541_05779 [Cyphellophora europaea CBS 101466]